jgi:hypothetical protein
MAIINEVPGTKGTIVVAKNYVRCDFLDLTDCVATGGARFFAGKNSVNSGGNNGWRFTDAAPRPPAVIRFSVQG